MHTFTGTFSRTFSPRTFSLPSRYLVCLLSGTLFGICECFYFHSPSLLISCSPLFSGKRKFENLSLAPKLTSVYRVINWRATRSANQEAKCVGRCASGSSPMIRRERQQTSGQTAVSKKVGTNHRNSSPSITKRPKLNPLVKGFQRTSTFAHLLTDLCGK